MSPTTVDRLKSLPLTIALTILIWMYAEAKFTTTGEARVSMRPVVSNGDLALRVFDPAENRFVPVVNVVASIQGPTNQVNALQQDPEPPPVTFSPPASALVPGAQNRVDTVQMLNASSYMRKHGLSVISATPAKMQVEVDRLEQVTRPVEFRPPVVVDHVLGMPDQVTVTIPSRTLQELGGAERLKVVAKPGRNLATLAIGQPQKITMRYVPEYAGQPDERITVTPAQTDVTLTVSKREAVTQLVSDVPVWVSGPPALLARYDVDLRTKFVPVIVSGSDPAIQALKNTLASSSRGTGGGDHGIHAYLDVSLDDRPTPNYLRRALRYVLPEGLSVQDAPGDVEFRLVQVGSTPNTAPAPSGR